MRRLKALKGVSVWCEYSLAKERYRLERRSIPIDHWEEIVTGREIEIETELFLIRIKRADSSTMEAGESDNLDFQVTASLKFDGLLYRLSVVLHTHSQSRGIIDRNGRHAVPIANRNWLGTKGVIELRELNSDRYCIVFCIKGFSSMEYERIAGQVWLNIDFADDHLMVHDDRAAIATDCSPNEIRCGHQFLSIFRIILDTTILDIPAILPHRNGCHGTLIFTEHACVTALETHEAVYFGESGSQENTGRGFVGHRIPVSKSIFYSNKTGVTNASQSPHFPGDMVSYLGTPAFAKMVEDLCATGLCEIGLHCVGPLTSESDEVAEACEVMFKKFGSRFWIDHVWFKSEDATTGSREGFCMEGLAWRGQPFRESAAVWKANGVKYFWNTAPDYLPSYWIEKVRVSGCFGDAGDCREIAHPIKYGIDNTDPDLAGVARPLYWTHPNIDPNFVSWPAKGAMDLVQDLSALKIEELLAKSGVANLHCYPTYAGKSSTWQYRDGKALITKEFDQSLALLAELRDQKKLSIDHLSTYLDYLLSLETVSWRKSPRGQIELKSSGVEDVMVTTSRRIRADESLDGASYWGTSISVERVKGRGL